MGIHAMLLGAGAGSMVSVDPVTVSELSTTPTTVSVTFSSNGMYFTTVNGSNSFLGNWSIPPSAAAEWEIRATLLSGVTPTTGTIGSWEALSTSRTWSLFRSSIGTSESILTFDFRRVGTTDPEVTSTPNVFSVEILDLF